MTTHTPVRGRIGEQAVHIMLAVLLSMGLTVAATVVRAETAQELYENYQQGIYQILLIERASGSKSTIGSGFQVSADGLIATNYHVIANSIYDPDHYRIQFIDHEGRTGELQLIDINVVHDLAILRHSEAQRTAFLPLAKGELKQGQDVYSIGNPRDLGMTVVPGTYNGLLEHRFYERILFSGSLNPGMSGGPSLNAKGEVIGINVATAGNQISFLIPVAELAAMLEKVGSDQRPLKERITEQLLHNQQLQFDEILSSPWPHTTMGAANIVSEMVRFTRCWGGTPSKAKARYELSYTRCYSEDNIYLASDFTTGILNYEFYWLESDSLSPWQFYSRYQNSLAGAQPVNNASEDHVGNYKCENDFVDSSSGDSVTWKTILCVRPYKDFSGLYDLLFIAASTSSYSSGLISHFALSGVSKETGLAFARRFMREVTLQTVTKLEPETTLQPQTELQAVTD